MLRRPCTGVLTVITLAVVGVLIALANLAAIAPPADAGSAARARGNLAPGCEPPLHVGA